MSNFSAGPEVDFIDVEMLESGNYSAHDIVALSLVLFG
jgi:hypothetical protein